MFVFKSGRPVAAFSLNFKNCKNLRYSPLAYLDRGAFSFAVTMYKERKVYMTGGSGSIKALSIFDADRNEWEQGPDLNHGRYGHSSTSIAGHVVVFGGFQNDGNIEALRVGKD